MAAFEQFSHVVGHQEQRTQLVALSQNQVVPHALVFVGSSGVGKRTVALSFVTTLLGGGKDGEQAAKLVSAGNHPDLHFAARDPDKKDLAVEAVRGLCSQLQLKPYCGVCSAAIIDNAHEMNIAASNALLMTLEEPPPNTYLILVTDAPHVLPPTILSRCQTIHFGDLLENEILQILSGLVEDKLDQPMLQALAAYAGSSLAPLQISAFVDARTSKVADPEGLTQHLRDLLARVARLDTLFKPLFDQGDKSNRLAYAVSLATHIAGDDALLSISWFALMTKLRRRLRRSTDPAACAEALTAAVEAEQLIRQRNLNTPLQLSNVLIKVAEIAD